MHPQSKNILFLTTANLSMKPRLVKEIQLAKELGYNVDLYAFKINNWTDKNHDNIVQNLNISCTWLYATRKEFTVWFIASIIHIIAKKLWYPNSKSLILSSFASNKRSIMLWFKLLFSSKKTKYDVVIGRNTATIYPLMYVSMKHKANIGFDVEDYHPEERISWTNPEMEKKRRIVQMQEVFKKCSYISFAGLPIKQEVINNFDLSLPESKLLNLPNTFSSSEFLDPEQSQTKSDKIRLIWFSLDITANRGLEEIIEAIKPVKDQFHLTLFGTQVSPFYDEWIKPNLDFINVEKPVTQKQLHYELKKYDIGLALEISKNDYNRELTVTNKIYAYLLSGLYVFATNTKGHEVLLKDSPNFGLICGQNAEDMKKSLLKVSDNIDLIRQNKKMRYEYSQNYAWENEKLKLKEAWESLNSI